MVEKIIFASKLSAESFKSVSQVLEIFQEVYLGGGGGRGGAQFVWLR